MNGGKHVRVVDVGLVRAAAGLLHGVHVFIGGIVENRQVVEGLLLFLIPVRRRLVAKTLLFGVVSHCRLRSRKKKSEKVAGTRFLHQPIKPAVSLAAGAFKISRTNAKFKNNSRLIL